MSQMATAAVYKCTDETGKTTYSNIPGPNCTNKESIHVPTTGDTNTDDASTQKFDAELGKYRHVGVTKPVDGQTFFLNSGELVVNVLTRPKLRRTHKIQVEVSGADISLPGRNRSIKVGGVGVGPHTVVAKILDKRGKVVSSSKPINIHVQKSTQVKNQETKDLDGNGNFDRTGQTSSAGGNTNLTDQSSLGSQVARDQNGNLVQGTNNPGNAGSNANNRINSSFGGAKGFGNKSAF
jgi:hypothetical protein